MRLPRKSRVITALFALFSVLFMQLAVAAYACPSMAEGKSVAYAFAEMTPAGQAAHDSMVGCEGTIDIEQPSLCYAHSQFGDQSSSTPEVPSFTPSLTAFVMPVIKTVEPPSRSFTDIFAASSLMRDSAPPLTIQNCCFRI